MPGSRQRRADDGMRNVVGTREAFAGSRRAGMADKSGNGRKGDLRRALPAANLPLMLTSWWR